VSSNRPNSAVNVVSLGCPKNDADTEVMLGILAAHGYRFVSEPEQADILLINTCAFIRPAVEESLGFIREAVERKRLDPHVKIVVAGCLPQRWRVSGETVPPEIDCVLGTGQYQRIAEALDRLSHGRRIRWLGEPRYLPPGTAPRIRITPPHYAYVRIADGCDNRCSYCLIPSLRGRYRSRSVRAIVSEAREAVASGAKEIVLVGQDTTLFAKDRSGSADLVTLLRAVSRIDGVRWIRVLYTYPAHFSQRLIETMRDLPNVVPYLDIPLQHSHDEILARMNRKGSSDDIRRLINTLRETIDGVAIRTTFIVGFPGERDRHFAHLMRFIERMRFDRAGVFTYSRENGTRAAGFPDQVPDEVKEARRAAAMSLQQEISLANNRRLIGERLTALIDGVCTLPVEGVTEDQWFAVGRTYRDAPEIDGQIFVDADSLSAGTMVEVEVTGAEAYDLIGKKV
jgi:ribosomal protein S12 methylthiotransferase